MPSVLNATGNAFVADLHEKKRRRRSAGFDDRFSGPIRHGADSGAQVVAAGGDAAGPSRSESCQLSRRHVVRQLAVGHRGRETQFANHLRGFVGDDVPSPCDFDVRPAPAISSAGPAGPRAQLRAAVAAAMTPSSTTIMPMAARPSSIRSFISGTPCTVTVSSGPRLRFVSTTTAIAVPYMKIFNNQYSN